MRDCYGDSGREKKPKGVRCKRKAGLQERQRQIDRVSADLVRPGGNDPGGGFACVERRVRA